MTNPRQRADLGAMMLDPNRYFDSPQAVVEDMHLSRTEKLSILRVMEVDARELQVATEENMPGDTAMPALADILDAIRQVAPDAAEQTARDSGGAMKH
ncbi:MAG: hypothetical protein ACFB22_10775 [Rhodothalassiaceae bacterium]